MYTEYFFGITFLNYGTRNMYDCSRKELSAQSAPVTRSAGLRCDDAQSKEHGNAERSTRPVSAEWKHENRFFSGVQMAL